MLGEEPILRELQEELEADKRYRDEWRTAQILFGRRQLKEAEQILTRLAAEKRPEAQALLETVREARSASEEEDFYNRGREKALKLIQQQQLEQAADLLRNLLSLFPGDPILERDLQSVQSLRAPEVARQRSSCGEAERRPQSRQRAGAGPLPSPALAAGGYPRASAMIGLVALLLIIVATVAIWGPPRRSTVQPVEGHRFRACGTKGARESAVPAPVASLTVETDRQQTAKAKPHPPRPLRMSKKWWRKQCRVATRPSPETLQPSAGSSSSRTSSDDPTAAGPGCCHFRRLRPACPRMFSRPPRFRRRRPEW